MGSVILGPDGRPILRDGRIVIGLAGPGSPPAADCCCGPSNPDCCYPYTLIRCGPGGVPGPICCTLGKRTRITATALASSRSTVEGASDDCNGVSFEAQVSIEFDRDYECGLPTTCRRADFDGRQTYWPASSGPACQRSDVVTTRRCINPGGEDVITAGGDNPMDPQGIWAIFRSWVGGRFPRLDAYGGDWTQLPCAGVDRITNQPGDLPYFDEIAWTFQVSCESATLQADWTYFQVGANGTTTRATASYYYTWRVEILEGCDTDPCTPIEPPPPPPACRSCLFPNGLCCNCVDPVYCLQQGGTSLPAGEACPEGTVCDCGEGAFGACILFTRGGQCFTTTRALCESVHGIYVPGRTCQQAGGQGSRPGRSTPGLGGTPGPNAATLASVRRWGRLRGGVEAMTAAGPSSRAVRRTRAPLAGDIAAGARRARGLPGQGPGGPAPDNPNVDPGMFTPGGAPGGCDPNGIDPETRCGCIVRGQCVEMPREQCLASGNVPLSPCRLCPGSQPVRVWSGAGGRIVVPGAGGEGYGPVRTCGGCGEGL